MLRTAIRQFIQARGGAFEAETIHGSLWEGRFSILSTRFHFPLSPALVVKANAGAMVIDFKPANFADRRANLISRLSIENGSITIEEITPDTTTRSAVQVSSARNRFRINSRWVPERLHVDNVQVDLATTHLGLNCKALSFSAGPETGPVVAHQLEMRVARSIASVEHLEGEALWRDAVLKFSNLPLASLDTIREFEVDLSQIGEQRLSCGLHLLAFGGIARGGLRIVNDDTVTPIFEMSGTLAGIDVGRFAKFLGREGAFGGTISDARYSFRGHPSNFEKATAAIRLRANAFRWRNRQWDSLILGATLTRRRIQFQNLQLRQPGNRIDFQGQADLPRRLLDADLPPFTCDVDAAIDDPAALLALFDIPAPALSGQIRAQGQISNESGVATGRLEICGSNLAVEKTRISDASATLAVNGPEFILESLTLRNADDVIEGAGTFSVSPIRTYKGQLSCSIAALDKYRAALSWWKQLPDGGRDIRATWSGDGTANAHSGAFSVQARNLKGLADLPELSGAIAGTYSPEFLYLDRFELSRGDVSFAARLAVSPQGLRLDDISFSESNRERLRGNITLPIKPGSLAAPLGKGFHILSDQKIEGTVRMNSLRTELLARFLGAPNSSLSAVVSGTVSVRGTPSTPAWSGTLVVSEGRFPSPHTPALLDKIDSRLVANDSMNFTFKNAKANLHAVGPIVLTGSLSLPIDSQPILHADIQQASPIELPVANLIRLSCRPSLALSGPLNGLTLSGTLTPIGGTLSALPVLNPSLDLVRPWAPTNITLPACLLDLTIHGSTTLSQRRTRFQTLTDLRLSGSSSQPKINGTIHITGSFNQSPAPLQLTSLTCRWDETRPARLAASCLLNLSGSAIVPLTFVQEGDSPLLEATICSHTPDALSAAWPQLTHANTQALHPTGTKLILGLTLTD